LFGDVSMEDQKSLKELRLAAREAGLQVFNVGVLCVRGHSSGRYTANNTCVDCHLAYLEKNKITNLVRDREYRAKNKLARAAKQKAYYRENTDACIAYQRQHYQSNRERRLAWQKDYYEENKGSVRAGDSRKRASRFKRVVDWGGEYAETTRHREQALHEMAVQLEAATGRAYNVDHMYPLQGRLVCGLHVCDNLQVIPQALNNAKLNKFILTEPGEWVLALSYSCLMKEPSWCKDAEKFYRELGWDFRKGRYTSGPYSSKGDA
jgi:hypothetical protein